MIERCMPLSRSFFVILLVVVSMTFVIDVKSKFGLPHPRYFTANLIELENKFLWNSPFLFFLSFEFFFSFLLRKDVGSFFHLSNLLFYFLYKFFRLSPHSSSSVPICVVVILLFFSLFKKNLFQVVWTCFRLKFYFSFCYLFLEIKYTPIVSEFTVSSLASSSFFFKSQPPLPVLPPPTKVVL